MAEQRRTVREQFQGKKTYIFAGLVILYSLLDWFELAPDEGSFDVGNSEAVGRALLAMVGATIRMAVARWMVATSQQLGEIQKTLDVLRARDQGKDN